MNNQTKINLPSFEIRIKKENDVNLVFDPIRKKYIILTPEEWVRQHFLNLLINHLGYPKGLMNVESGHIYFKNIQRSDITIHLRNQSFFMLVECKSPDVSIDSKTLKQISQYNKKIEAKYICVTNGIKHFIWAYDLKENSYSQLDSFPVFPE